MLSLKMVLVVVFVGTAMAGCTSGTQAGGEGIALEDARTSGGTAFSDTILMAFRENESLRDALIADAERYEPEQVAEVTADGQVTMEEFLSLQHVRNVVAHYTTEFQTTFEGDLADISEQDESR